MKKITLTFLKIAGFIIVFALLEFLTQPIVNLISNIITNDYIVSLIKIFLDIASALTAVKIFLRREKLKNIGLNLKAIDLKKLLLTGLSSIILSTAVTGVIYLLKGYEFQGYIWNKLYIEDIIPFFIVGVLDSLSSSIINEIPIRGYIYRLVSYKNKYIGAGITAVIYMFLHVLDTGFNITALLGLMLFSIFLSLIFIITGNLVYNIVFHMFWYFTNAYIFSSPMGGTENPGLFFLQYNEKTLLNGGIFGINASIIFIVLMLLLDIFLFLRLHHRKG